MLVDEFLGSNWGVVVSDVSGGDKGNGERLAYLYDRRRVTPSGLAGEIVLPTLERAAPRLPLLRSGAGRQLLPRGHQRSLASNRPLNSLA